MPIPSVEKVETFDENLDSAEEFVNSTAETFTTHTGLTRQTITGVINSAVQRPIVPFDENDAYPDDSLWVEQPPSGGAIYRPKPSALPIAAGTFDPADWVLVQAATKTLTVNSYAELANINLTLYSAGSLIIVAGDEPRYGLVVNDAAHGLSSTATRVIIDDDFYWDSSTSGAIEAWLYTANDGSDDLAVLQQLADSGCSRLLLGSETYTLIAGGLVVPRGVSVVGDGAIIDATGIASSSTAVVSDGEVSASTTLSGDVALDANSIGVTSAAGIEAGTWIQIQSTLDNSWSGFRTYRKQGFFLVQSVSGTTLTLANRTRTTFESASSVVNIVAPNTGVFSGFTVKCPGSGDASGVSINYGIDFEINQIKVVDADIVGIGCGNSVGTNIKNSQSVINAAAVDTQYAVSVSSSQNTVVRDCILSATRHAVAIVGSHQTINTKIFDSHLTASLRAADAHGNADQFLYERCTIDGGITFSGRDGTYRDCDISRPSTTTALILQTVEVMGGKFEIVGGKSSTLSASLSSGFSVFDIGRGNTAIDGDTRQDVTIKINDHNVDIPNVTSTNFIRMGNSSAYKVNFDVQDINLNHPNCLEFIRYESAPSGSDADFVIIDNIRGAYASGLTLFKAGTGASGYATTDFRMPTVIGTVSVSYSSGANTAAFTFTYPYVYPETPTPTISYVGAKNPSGAGGNEIYTSITAQSASSCTVTMTTIDGSTFGSSETATVNFNVSLNQIY